jgi:small subunit ribosomal protein S17
MATPETQSTRRTVIGVVTSDKMDKTIAVAVERLTLHPRFKKYVREISRYKAHDETEEARVGDKVRIAETRPLSKTKHWRLVDIVERAPRVE